MFGALGAERKEANTRWAQRDLAITSWPTPGMSTTVESGSVRAGGPRLTRRGDGVEGRARSRRRRRRAGPGGRRSGRSPAREKRLGEGHAALVHENELSVAAP